ncbi:MAG TPA: response regulator transcription factor, partial [Verrucomicrobiae bacterium]|nr:response regulator transcription factor [Verrucomicrobiae bacterium]
MKTISATSAPARANVAATPNQPGGLAGHIQSSISAGSVAAKSVNPTKPRIKVMLVDDHPVVRKGVSSCLARHEHLQVIAEASDGREAVTKARQLQPNVILMDIDMPHMNGLAVTELLRKELPDIKVLILSMHSNTDYVMRIIQSGARGYVLKEAPTEELVRAVDAVHAGEAFFSPEVAHAALN